MRKKIVGGGERASGKYLQIRRPTTMDDRSTQHELHKTECASSEGRKLKTNIYLKYNAVEITKS